LKVAAHEDAANLAVPALVLVLGLVPELLQNHRLLDPSLFLHESGLPSTSTPMDHLKRLPQLVWLLHRVLHRMQLALKA
jgi:hypothetical protein